MAQVGYDRFMGRRIECGERFVKEYNVRPDGKRTGKADSTRFTARQGPDRTFLEMADTEELKVFENPLFDAVFTGTPKPKACCDIFKNCRVEKKRLLKYHRHMSAVVGHRDIRTNLSAAKE